MTRVAPIFFAVFATATPATAADIVLTPPAGGAVNMTNSTGSTSRLRVGEDGSISITGNFELGNSSSTQGNLYKNGQVFLHNNGSLVTFVGQSAGNLASAAHTNNTGIGAFALSSVTGGSNNTACGASALAANTSGHENTASGNQALSANTIGFANTAVGESALLGNTSGTNNTGLGRLALDSNTTGNSNTAVGSGALGGNTTGGNNIALGVNAGSNYTTGNGNIAINNAGVAAEASTIRIGTGQGRAFIAGIFGVTTAGAAGPVLVDVSGQLGVVSSSRRVKDRIADMDAASEALMRLRPVTFHYPSHGPDGPLQYGLVAEEVAEVYPDLVMHGADGKIQTVMYQYLPPMLLNEVQKQQRAIAGQQRTIARQGEQIATLERRLASMADALRKLAGEEQQ